MKRENTEGVISAVIIVYMERLVSYLEGMNSRLNLALPQDSQEDRSKDDESSPPVRSSNDIIRCIPPGHVKLIATVAVFVSSSRFCCHERVQASHPLLRCRQIMDVTVGGYTIPCRSNSIPLMC